MCSREAYENIDNFEWLLSVLVDLAYVARVDVGLEIKNCLIEVALREPSIRTYAVKLMAKMLEDDTFVLNAGESGSCAEALGAAGWICGEYAR
jgi:AP-3 complex subunit delta-1